MTRKNNMQLTPNEIESVDDIGILNGSPVKIIKTRGGFHIAVGRPRGKLQEEALAAGSHPAIVKFNLERQHPDFQPAMQKSELMGLEPKVESHSHFLSDSLRKSGHDLYSVQTGDKVEFHITKQNAKVSSVDASFDKGSLVFGEINIDKKFTRALAGATSEKALSANVSKIRIQGE
jgi:hypothetical protein